MPLIRFALFPLLRRTTELKEPSVGALTDFSSWTEPVMRTIQIEQVDGWRKAISEKAVYVTKDSQGQLRVLTSICPHLGCTVPWNKEKNQFVCPCHGATFTADGTRGSGPSPRGMDMLETSIRDGHRNHGYPHFGRITISYPRLAGHHRVDKTRVCGESQIVYEKEIIGRRLHVKQGM